MDAVPMVADRREALLALGSWFVLGAGAVLLHDWLPLLGGRVAANTGAAVVVLGVSYLVWLTYIERACLRLHGRVEGRLRDRIQVREKQARLRIGPFRSFFPAIRTLVTGKPAGSVNLTPR